MGLDGTIRRADGRPLGTLDEVRRALVDVFPGIILGQNLSGAERIRIAAERGIEFPEVLRKSLERIPAKFGADYVGPEFSAEFLLGADETVQTVDVVPYGNTVAAEPMFEALTRKHGWITTHP